jgi:hypothetical protein
MAMTRITPLEVAVDCDWFDGRPKRLHLGDERLPLVVEGVRREAAAYPPAQGPRTVFQVRTPASRLALTFRHRDRRWLVEALDPTATLVPAA